MKKFIFSLTLPLLMIGVFASQAQYANAETKNIAITSPITYFAIQGKILLRDGKRRISADNIKITAKNLKTKEEIQTRTDADGNYIIQVTPGKYKVRATKKSVSFRPGNRIVEVFASISNIDFTGK